MVSIGKLTSTDQVVRYFAEATAKDPASYYLGKSEAPGRWAGKGATSLGLSGAVDEDVFRAVLAGVDPRSGNQLGTHHASHKVVAFDLTFSAPKSVSVLYALAGDEDRERLLTILQRGVDEAMEYVENQAAWGRVYNRKTRKLDLVRADLIAPRFVHRTSRPVTDPATGETTVDPQLHVHVPVANWVHRANGTWGQLYSEPLFDHAASTGAIAQAVWRAGIVREFGLDVAADPNGCFEIAGFTRAELDEFSRRTRQVELMEEAEGADSLLGHKVAVVASRESKKEIEGIDVFRHWKDRASAVGLTPARLAEIRSRRRDREPQDLSSISAREVVGENGLTREAATFTRRQVIRAVAARARDGASRAQVEARADEILADAAVVALLPQEDSRHRTALGRAEEARDLLKRWADRGVEVRYSTTEMKQLEDAMLASALARQGLGVALAAPSDVGAAVAARPTLTAGQRALIDAVCSDGHGVTIIQGSAGVGKTYALGACREALAASGHTVLGCALAGRAATELEDEAGIVSTTIASTLRILEDDHLPNGAVLVVDEAGMVGSRQMAKLLELAERDGAKLVLVGDAEQLQPIHGGGAFRALGDRLGRTVLSENLRQSEAWERHTLDALHAGRIKEAISEYLKHGRVNVAMNAFARRVNIVNDAAELRRQGHEVVVLARTRAESDALNAMARLKAVDEQVVAGPAITVNGKVFQAGDELMCLQTRMSEGKTNGMRARVTSVDSATQSLTAVTSRGDPIEISAASYRHIDYGYAMTVHKGQGLTADVALVMGTERGSKQWAYTALSRAKAQTIYYAIDHDLARDKEGITHAPDQASTLEQRLLASWARDDKKDSTLDYPDLYRAVAGETLRSGRAPAPTERQLEYLKTLGGPEPEPGWTWVEASIAIDRMLGHELGAQAREWLTSAGLDPRESDALVSHALERAQKDGDFRALNDEEAQVARERAELLELMRSDAARSDEDKRDISGLNWDQSRYRGPDRGR